MTAPPVTEVLDEDAYDQCQTESSNQRDPLSTNDTQRPVGGHTPDRICGDEATRTGASQRDQDDEIVWRIAKICSTPRVCR